MGLFKKPKKPKEDNYLNFRDALNSPYVISKVQAAMLNDLGKVRPIVEHDVFKYLGTPRHCVEILFPDATLRLTNDPEADIVFSDGRRFISDGTLVDFEDIKESQELNQKGGTIKIKGTSPLLIEVFNKRRYLKSKVNSYIAFLTNEKDKTRVTWFLLDSGFIDKPEIVLDAIKGTAEMKISTTSMLDRLSNTPGARTANAVHKAQYPNDNFFKFANKTESSKKQRWKMN